MAPSRAVIWSPEMAAFEVRVGIVNVGLDGITAHERLGFMALAAARLHDGAYQVPMKPLAEVVPERDLAAYLAPGPDLDFDHPQVAQLAQALRCATPEQTARACFDWVRDRIPHVVDAGRDDMPCSASETLAAGTGLCHAKSHLLVALLRANGIPAGLGYQRLTWDGPLPPHCLHGFVAVWLAEHGWYRCDARGNTRSGVDARFTPGVEHLAFLTCHPGEHTCPQIHAQPLPELVARLRACTSLADYLRQPIDLQLPEWQPLSLA
ncbi:hypothetical protein GCM10007860_33500 [Chitiniphilus shinanonensis]|uniref:Transglutaminase-like domain-containing protein n=1 Tax=Chitiniphilus shinanonensis TaxID=553088 RepID=A0ABQ6BW24_9NEIS|nr:transglutaminase family protein [Chitiniphilus shinanonensis]GLS06180.1 hypothetical protein GCM10007860_33500 [Chitiniphilus shinanonensis]